MKITKRQLRRIIKEEKARLLSEIRPPFKGGYQHEEPDNSEVKPTPGGYAKDSFDGSHLDLDDHNRMVQQTDNIIISFVKMGYAREDVVYALKGILEEI